MHHPFALSRIFKKHKFPLLQDYENFISYICKAYKGTDVPKACSKIYLKTLPKQGKAKPKPQFWDNERMMRTLSKWSTIISQLHKMNLQLECRCAMVASDLKQVCRPYLILIKDKSIFTSLQSLDLCIQIESISWYFFYLVSGV